MSTLRFQAIKETLRRKPVAVDEPARRSTIFGKNVFNEAAMRQYLTKESYNSVVDATVNGSKINRNVADHISTGMKEWAINNGATHYTHWFQDCLCQPSPIILSLYTTTLPTKGFG